MSLYTPVFPPLHEFDASQKSSLRNNSVATLGRQQNYVKSLRDLHLFLSSQNDVLSPPSRPNSPSADHRIQKMKNRIQDIFGPSGGETSSGKWTRAGQTLKLRCARGRHWSVSQAHPCVPEQNTDWILPDEEAEWFEWEKKREENRRLRGKTKASHQIGGIIPATPESQDPDHAGFAETSQHSSMQRQRRPQDVSPGTMRAAKEKVRKWQALVVPHHTPRSASPAPSREVEIVANGKRETARPQRNGTLGFTVVKPAARPFAGKKKNGTRGNSSPTPSRRSKTPTKPSNEPQGVAPVDGDQEAPKDAAQTPPAKGDMTKISNVSETPYLPPSFPSHLETSTPLPDSKILVRTKPLPILPISSSTPPPSTPANPPDDPHAISVEAHVANESSYLPPQLDIVQGKRSRIPSAPVDGPPNDLPVTPPAKRPRSLSQNGFAPASIHLKLISPNGALNDVRDPNGAAPSQRPLDFLDTALDVSLTPGNIDPANGAAAQDSTKIPSPAKSVKSYFSAPDSDPADSPVKANLLLESPISPMLSYAQNPSIFLPQITSTQARKGSPTPGQASNGIIGMGYSSQFDVERHVDRVSELLEKDVDFDGWMRDVRTVEMSHD